MGHALGNNYGKFYSFLSKPVELDLNFTVDATNGNGLGVRSVKGQGVKNVFMATSASFTGNSHTSTTIDGISGGTSSLVVGMIIAGSGIVAGTTIVSIPTSGSIIISVATTSTVSGGTITYVAVGSPMVNTGVATSSVGYALIELEYNYTRNYGGPLNLISPVTGANVAINSSALTVGLPYVIVSVGHGEAGTATIAPVADVSGNLAGTWFKLFDNYGNTFVIWFSVSGVGSAPIGTGGILVQQSISTNDTAATIGTDLAITIAALPSGISGVFSFTATGTTTVTVVSTQHNPYQPLPGAPSDGTIPTGFTFAVTKYISNLQDWQKVGVPPGVVPAVGVSFIATATGYSTGGGSTGLVKAVGVSSILSVETIGDPNLSLSPIPMGGSANTGGWILIQFLAPTVSGSAYDTPMIPTAPANNTVVSMNLLLEQATRVGGNNE